MTRVAQLLRVPVAGLALVAVGTFLYVIAHRLAYPYELEWLESGVLEHVRRVHDGLSLYTAPSVDFVQFGYSPLYMLSCGLVSFLFGVNFEALRFVSLLSTFATFLLMYRVVRYEQGGRLVAVIGVGLYAACFQYVAGWFDVGKPDSMFLALTLWSVFLTRKQQMTWAGVVMALAILTKQTAVFVALPICVYLVVTRWRTAIAYCAPLLAIVGGVTLMWNLLSHGWFVYYVWEQLGEQGLVEDKLAFWYDDLQPLWPLGIVIAAGVLTGVVTKVGRDKLLWIFAAVGMIAGSWLSRIHEGGWDNVLMPACLAICLLAAISMAILSNRGLLSVAALALCGFMFASMQYDVASLIPTRADRLAGDAFISRVRGIDGDVLITSHPTYAVLAGKTSHAQQGGTVDVLRATKEHPKALLRASFASAIEQRKFAAIILDDSTEADAFPADWTNYYARSEDTLFANNDVFRPVASPTGQPAQLWLRKPQ